MKLYKVTASILITACLFLFFNSCDLFKNKNDDAYLKNIKVNPEFEMNPPIADDVLIKRIKGDDNNVFVIAKFSPSRFKEKFLAFQYDSTKLVMRDDGKGGDENAADGLYTVKVNTSEKEFEKIALSYYKQSQNQKRFVFKGRSIITDTAKFVFNLDKFIAGDGISIKDLFPVAPQSLKDHSLIITDLSVVEDPARTWNFCTQTGNIDGPWTFKTLMKNLAATSPGSIVTETQLSDFVEHWFAKWLNTETVNGESVNRRIEMDRSIESWRTNSQLLPLPRVSPGKIDMRAIPVKLMAIVNRLDLRGNSGYGFSNAGEARLVFCLMSNNGCTPLRFNIIFEYGVPLRSCTAIKAYAQEWYDLKDLAFTDPLYTSKLELITNQFTLCGTSPEKPNQSSLNQLRSNEISLSFPWELREFNLDNTTHLLKSVTVKQTPALKYNAKINNADVHRLATYINSTEAAILANNFTVPETFSGNTFMGGHALIGNNFSPGGTPPLLPVGMPSGVAPDHWNATTSPGPAFINSDNARQIFSLNTCNGCHGGETQTAFTMIDPVPFGTQATLSGFLTGTPGISAGSIAPVDLDGANEIMNVPDPSGRSSSNDLRKFNDLQRRADDLQVFVSSSCRSVFRIRDILTRSPLKFVH